MVVVLDPPPEEAQTAPRKRGGGPRTVLGRMKSRENSVKTSLRSKVVFSKDMASRILDRNRILEAQFNPKTRYELMLIADMALAKARADRCAELRVENEDRILDRTMEFWHQDQCEKAQKLRKRLARDPATVALKLSGFKQGVDLKISLWEGLGEALRINGDWDDEQRRLSLDLREVDPALRVGNILLRGLVDPATLAETVAREIDRLEAIKDQWLDQHDRDAHDDALIGLCPDDHPTAKKLRRYEAMAQRDYDKAFAELQRVKAEGEAKCKDGYVKSTLRAWDVDALIIRIKTIHDPPNLYSEPQPLPAPRPAANPSELTLLAPLPAEIDVPAPIVTPGVTTPAPAACEAAPAIAVATPIEDPITEALAEWASATSFTDTEAATAPELAEKAPLCRRARKVLQRRLREAAKREAG